MHGGGLSESLCPDKLCISSRCWRLGDAIEVPGSHGKWDNIEWIIGDCWFQLGPGNQSWKRLKGKNPEGKNFRRLLRRKQSSAKISKISRTTLKSGKRDIFYLLRNLLKYLPRTFFSSAKFSEVFTLCVFTLWLFPTKQWRIALACFIVARVVLVIMRFKVPQTISALNAQAVWGTALPSMCLEQRCTGQYACQCSRAQVHVGDGGAQERPTAEVQEELADADAQRSEGVVPARTWQGHERALH